jgi:hypothetical protein
MSYYDWRSLSLGVESSLELVTKYYFLSERCSVVSVGRPLWREVGSFSSQSLSAVFSPLSKFNLIHFLHVTHVLCIYNIYTRPLSAQAQYNRSCPIICTLRYNSSLGTWMVARLTAAKFKPLIFPVLGFALPYIADMWIFMILYGFCLLPA